MIHITIKLLAKNNDYNNGNSYKMGILHAPSSGTGQNTYLTRDCEKLQLYSLNGVVQAKIDFYNI